MRTGWCVRCVHYDTDAQRRDGGDSGGEGLTRARGKELLHGGGLKHTYTYQKEMSPQDKTSLRNISFLAPATLLLGGEGAYALDARDTDEEKKRIHPSFESPICIARCVVVPFFFYPPQHRTLLMFFLNDKYN